MPKPLALPLYAAGLAAAVTLAGCAEAPGQQSGWPAPQPGPPQPLTCTRPSYDGSYACRPARPGYSYDADVPGHDPLATTQRELGVLNSLEYTLRSMFNGARRW